jgi:hypothetical protein
VQQAVTRPVTHETIPPTQLFSGVISHASIETCATHVTVDSGPYASRRRRPVYVTSCYCYQYGPVGLIAGMSSARVMAAAQLKCALIV